MHFGVYTLAGDDEISYLCGIDGGIARGGQKRKNIPFGASTPCRMGYAANCPIYKTELEETSTEVHNHD